MVKQRPENKRQKAKASRRARRDATAPRLIRIHGACPFPTPNVVGKPFIVLS